MPRKTRKSISLKGITYQRLKRHCEAQGKSISGTVEKWTNERLRKTKPSTPHFVYEVHDETEASWTSVLVVAPSPERAQQWAALQMGWFPDTVEVKPTTKDYDQSRITYAHLGVVTEMEFGELCP